MTGQAATDESSDWREAVTTMLDWVGRIARRITPEFVRRRYAAKFAISMLVVVVVIAGLGGASYAEIQSELHEETQNQLQSQASMQASAVGSWVREMQVQTRFISDAEPVRTGDKRAVDGYLTTAQNHGTLDIAAVHIVDTEAGQLLSSTEFELDGESIAGVDRPWADQVDSVDWYSSSMVTIGNTTYEQDNETVLAFVSPVPDSDRAVVVVGSIERRITGFAGSETGSRMTIVDKTGEVVLAPDGTGGNAVSNGSAFTAAVEDGRVESLETDRDVRAYAPIKQTDWVVAVSLGTREAYAIGRSVGTNVLVIITGSVLALGLVATALGRQTVRPLKQLRRRAEGIQDGDLETELSTPRDDEIGRLFDRFDDMRQSLREQFTETESALADARDAREDAESARNEARALSQTLEDRASQFGSTMRACADGELHHRLDETVDNESMAEIAVAFNEMIDDFESTIADVRGFADDVAAASIDVAERAEDVEARSNRVSQRVDGISDAASEQSQRLDRMTEETAALSGNIEEVAASASEVADATQRSVDRGTEGRAATEDALEKMEALRTQATETVDQMNSLDEQVRAIGDVADLIAEIAEQTNLLALNANIEAAAANGEDDGFGVVADEVKQLAAETADATDDIADRIEAVQTQTDHTATEMTEMREAVGEASSTVTEVQNALDEIVDSVESADHSAAEIDRATGEQARTTQEVASDIDDVAEISRTVTDRAQAVAETASEQSRTMSTVTARAEALRDRATTLSERLATFETDRTDATPTDTDESAR
ncbi:methyl-accepting chemotaxis protein [Halohasta litorea]|uniref:Methyl-accepting chemotaxis protein n=1 Tax=Halohasta litorea TaxID=869891 RepID=A0ABD6DB96_9EURY|nr:methyl-accepting chemotaxis protein [Halohasta litorea]